MSNILVLHGPNPNLLGEREPGGDGSPTLPESATALRERAAAIVAMPPADLPSSLRATLRPYQKEGFQFLAHLSAHGFGGVLADDMGLGKTVQALAWLLHLAELSRQQAASTGRTPPFRARRASSASSGRAAPSVASSISSVLCHPTSATHSFHIAAPSAADPRKRGRTRYDYL